MWKYTNIPKRGKTRLILLGHYLGRLYERHSRNRDQYRRKRNGVDSIWTFAGEPIIAGNMIPSLTPPPEFDNRRCQPTDWSSLTLT